MTDLCVRAVLLCISRGEMYTPVCVCERERARERAREGEREGEREGAERERERDFCSGTTEVFPTSTPSLPSSSVIQE